MTGAAITGNIGEEGGGFVAGAQVSLRNPSTGDSFQTTSSADGDYFFDNVPPGGPYTVTAQAEGYQVTSQAGITVTLGQRLKVPLELKFQVGQVEEIVIVEEFDKLYDQGRTGLSSTVKEEQLKKLPVASRDFTDLIGTAPGASSSGGGTSVGGQNNKYNNIQIDGGANNDLFGLAASGTPGGQSNAKPISIEAVKEFVVMIAPFDVRQGSFTGGLVNAITKAGSNDYHGSVFNYVQTQDFAGDRGHGADAAAACTTDACRRSFNDDLLGYSTWQFGGTISGPVIKDKVHFFVAADFQERRSAFGNQFQIGGQDAAADTMRAGFSNADAQRFESILQTKYGITAGDALPIQLANPNRNVFAKVSTSLIKNSKLEISYNFVRATNDILGRQPTAPRIPAMGFSVNLRDGYQLSNSGYQQFDTTHTPRLKLASSWGKISNELLLSASIVRDGRDMPQKVPLILVKVGRVGAADAFLAAGGERFSHINRLDQDIYQIQDNVTVGFGDHRLTVGTSNEFLTLYNAFFQAAYGVWGFNSLDELEAGTPTVFQRRLGFEGSKDPGIAKFNVAQLGLYVQDEWTLMKNLVITPGFRVDVPFLSEGQTNQKILDSALAIDTGKLPSGNPLLSPRIGANWDILGDASTIIRGGAGIFSGRPPYVWVGNAYSVNGLQTVDITCRPMAAGGTGIPEFTANPDAQPSSCAGGSGIPAAPANVGEIDWFDPDTKYPQSFRAALGVDRRLPWDVIASADLLYTRDVNGWYTTDSNLMPQGLSGDGRQLYGTFGMTGFQAIPTRIDSMNLVQAIKVYNKSGGGVWNATVQASKTFLKKKDITFDVNVAYTFTKAEDLISLTSTQAFSNLQFAPLDGTLENRNARTAAFERPHNIRVTGVASLPFGFGVGLTYSGQSGLPYTWVVNGDVNADGMSSNDLAYVPAAASEITLRDDPNNPNDEYEDLDAFIQNNDCLKGARGRFVKRGECRNPWSNLFNLKLAWTSPPLYKDGHRFEVQLDIFNFLNMLNSDWGLFDQATDVENHRTQFLRAVGYDTTNNRPIYSFAAPAAVETTIFSPTSSRWRIQLGARYSF